MDSVKASYFKNHFGAVLDRAGERAVRIERRGRAPAILLPEVEYRALRERKLASSGQKQAMERLRELALEADRSQDARLHDDPRAAAVLKKHSRHLKS